MTGRAVTTRATATSNELADAARVPDRTRGEVRRVGRAFDDSGYRTLDVEECLARGLMRRAE
jgi:hypothetical protein